MTQLSIVDEKELETSKKQVAAATKAAEAIVINSSEQLNEATELLSKIKKVGKIVTDEKEKITKPLNEALKAARSMFAPIEKAYAEAEQTVKSKMLVYYNEVDRKAKEAEAKIAKQLEEGKIKKEETAANKIAKIEQAEVKVESKSGSAQFRTVRVVKITDETLIPRKYLVVDMVAVRKDALAGIEIAGVKVEEEKQIAGSSY